MLTFYYHPLSPIARLVWLALLEKDIPFTPVIIDLSSREQFQPNFRVYNSRFGRSEGLRLQVLN